MEFVLETLDLQVRHRWRMWRIGIIGGFYHAATQGYEAFGGEVES